MNSVEEVDIKAYSKATKTQQFLVSGRLHTNKNILMNIIFQFCPHIPLNRLHNGPLGSSLLLFIFSIFINVKIATYSNK